MLDKLKKEVVTEDELKRVKAYIKGIMVIHFEKTSSKNAFIANSFLKNESMDIEDLFKKIDVVTAENIIDFANKYFRKDGSKNKDNFLQTF